MRDVFGVPFYPVVFQVLMVLTFAIHIIFVNIVMGSTALAIWGRIKGGDYYIRLSRGLARTSTIATSLAIVVGVAPLLFVQVIYDPFWYTSAQISAWWALLFLVSIAVSFTCSYLFYLGGKGRGGSLFWALVSLAALLITAVIIHGISVQMLSPEKWHKWIDRGTHVDLSGGMIHTIDLPRLLHFILPALAITGVYLMLYGWYYRGKYSDSYVNWVASFGAKLALYVSCLQGLVGLWWLLTEKPHFMVHPLTILAVLGGASFVGYLFKIQNDPVDKAIPTAIFAFVVVLLMSAARELLRYLKLSSVGYSLYSYKLSLSLGSTVLFFATFIMGLLVISYPIMVAYKVGKSKEKLLELPELNLWGKIAVALPMIWFVVVAVLGLAISIKNGTLF